MASCHPIPAAHRYSPRRLPAPAVAADKALFTTIAQLTAAVASFDAIRAGFDVTSLQDYAIAREARR